MRQTDYNKIAPHFDANKERLQIEVDAVLTELIKQYPQHPLGVLDVGCGTGNYLQVQVNAFPQRHINNPFPI